MLTSILLNISRQAFHKIAHYYQDARNEAANDDANSGLARFIFSIFGAKEVYDLKTNPNLDPMTRMVSAGHDMVGGSLVWFGLGAASTGASFIAGMRGKSGISDFFSSAASLMFAIAVVGFTAGVFLAYVLPLLPFIYFSFAVIGLGFRNIRSHSCNAALGAGSSKD